MPLVPHVSPNTTITSAWGNLVADHTVMRFATAAQRSSQLTAPAVGQLSELDTAIGVLQVWTGTAWVTAPAGAWTAFTPDIVGSSGPTTVGNGSILGRYRLLGEKTVTAAYKFTAGSTSTYNAGGVRISLPFQAAAPIVNAVIGSCLVNLAGGLFAGVASVDNDRNYTAFYSPVATSSSAVAGIANTHMNTSSVIVAGVTYEMA